MKHSTEQQTQCNKIKGKIIRGAAYSSLYKSTYASIPSKTENFLDSETNKQTQNCGFISHSERFTSSATPTPGIGTYNLTDKPIIHAYHTSMSSKGYCNGFVSTSSRLKDNEYYNINPGPGNYKDETCKSIENDVKHSLHCKSLYKEHTNHSIIDKGLETPGPSRYDPNKFDNWKLRNKNYIYNFNSYPKRQSIVEKYKLIIPGPGHYYKNGNVKDVKGVVAWNEKKVVETEIEKLNGLGIATDGNVKGKDGVNKVNNKKKVFKNGDMCIHIHNTSTQDHAIIYRQKCKTENGVNANKNKEGSIQNIRFRIEEEKELNYLKQFLGNDNAKPDIFYLNSPRWKNENALKYKAPGPAYYIPRNPRDKFSYNKNSNDFICPGGAELD
jgi:hypothetical protein